MFKAWWGPVQTPQPAAKSRAKHSGTVVSGRGRGRSRGGDLQRGAGCSPRTEPPARRDTGEAEDRAELKTLRWGGGHRPQGPKNKERDQETKTQPVQVGVVLASWPIGVEYNSATHAKRGASIGSRRGHAGHGGAHPLGSTGEETQSVEVESRNQVGLKLQGQKIK